VAYLVRSFRTYARIRSLTTGTFNRIFKDRITFRLSGAYSVQSDTHKCESDRPRNLLTIPSTQPPVNATPAQHFHPFSTRDGFAWGQPPRLSSQAQARRARDGYKPNRGKAALQGRVKIPLKGRALAPADARNGIAFRPEKTPFQRASRSGRQKIEKRTNLWRSLL